MINGKALRLVELEIERREEEELKQKLFKMNEYELKQFKEAILNDMKGGIYK